MQPRGNDLCGFVRCIAIKPRENSVRGRAQIEGDTKAKEVENSFSIDLYPIPRILPFHIRSAGDEFYPRKTPFHKLLDGEWLLVLL